MALGSAIGGIGSMMSGFGAMSGAKQAAGLSKEMMEKMEQRMEEAWAYGKENIDIADSFRYALEEIAAEYGQYANDVWNQWEQMYGPLEKNLVDYYNNLDPEKYSTQWKAGVEQELNKQFKQFEETAAQSGLYTSGMRQQAQKEMAFKQAQANAMADIQAPDYVAQQKQQFYGNFGAPQKATAQGLLGQSILNEANLLNMGVGQQMNARTGMMNMATNQANQYMDAANMYGRSAAGYGQAAGNMFGQGMNMLFGGGGGGGGGFLGGLFG